MAGTIKTIAQLITDIPVGTPAGTSAQDIQNIIESLAKGQRGYADYNDTTTAGTPITLAAGVWTDVTNDKAGTFTREVYPVGVTSLFNAGTNKIDWSELPIDATVRYRLHFMITTGSANTDVDARISLAEGHAGAFTVPLIHTIGFKTAAAHDLPISEEFYVGPNTNDNPGSIQVRSEKASTLVVLGWVQFIDLLGRG